VLDYQQSTAWLVKGRRKLRRPVASLRVGDRVLVSPGDRIPVDGTVVIGTAIVDEQSFNGESIPRAKRTSDHVFASTIVQDGIVQIRATQVGNDTKAAKIVRMVETGATQGTTMQNYAERWANDLVPYSFAGAGVRALLGGGANGAASVLVIDYGTGIRVAAPTAVLATMAEGVRHGVLFKGGRSLEALAAVDAVLFDKTGTLSVGRPSVVALWPYGRWTSRQILALAASAEGRLNHPVAKAIVRAAGEGAIVVHSPASWRYTIGRGVAAEIDGLTVHVGSLHYMTTMNVSLDSRVLRRSRRFAREAISTVYVAVDGSIAGLIGYADAVRPEAPGVIAKLHGLGIRQVSMLTGDQRDIASRVAKEVGITEFAAELLPEHKLAYLSELQRQGLTVAVVGDGINDSPALAHADVGIALKGGADVAEDVAHVVMLNGTLGSVPTAIELAREAMDVIHQSWRIISVPNTIALGLAFLGSMGPGMATVLSNGAAVVAIGHALRPLWQERTGQKRAHTARRTTRSVNDWTRALRMTVASGA
jgi:Cu2+-exporting ATPase